MDTATTNFRQVAQGIRSRMFDQNKTISELATVIGRSRNTAAARLRGEKAFDLNELDLISDWLEVAPYELMAVAA